MLKVSCIQFNIYIYFFFWKVMLWGDFFSVEGCTVLEGCNPHSYSSFFLLLFVCVLRLLAQLHETESAFDEFWIKHQQKLEQCLHLRNFEQNFREVRTSWWQSIFGNVEVIQKQILPLLFSQLSCVYLKAFSNFFLWRVLTWQLAIFTTLNTCLYRHNGFSSVVLFFSMNPAVYKRSKTPLKSILYHRSIMCRLQVFHLANRPFYGTKTYLNLLAEVL